MKQRIQRPGTEMIVTGRHGAIDFVANVDWLNGTPPRTDATSPHQHMNETAEELYRTFGQAVANVWSNLPSGAQHELSESAASSGGEVLRQRLATFLHAQYSRTVLQ
jgi:hypothetical protein